MYITLINKYMTTYLSKNELSYDIDFGTDDDCLEVAQLFDEASEGLVKYYHDDIFNISGDLPIPSTGITEFAKFMSTSETQRVYNGQVNFDGQYLSYDDFDGLSLVFKNWRFNLRSSNTEPLVRLNVETKNGSEFLNQCVTELTEILVN